MLRRTDRRAACLVLLASVCLAQTTPASDTAFRDFIGWYRNYKGSFLPPEVAKAYSAELAKKGMQPKDIEQRISLLMKRIGEMPPEFAGLHFDHIYSATDAPFRKDASDYLTRAIAGRKPGRALDVAMGQGRNALFLASQGWDVTGYDISEEGLAQANAAAKKAGLSVKTVLASHATFDYGHEQWDLIVQTFAFNDLADEAYRRRVVDSLKPGGLLVIEGFGSPEGSGPKNVMLAYFKELRVLDYEDRDDVSDWGLRSMRLNRLTAQRD